MAKRILARTGLTLLIAAICFVMIAPVYIIVKVSFAEPWEVLTQHPTLLPHSFTLRHWTNVITSGNLWPALYKSLVVAFSTMFFSILVVAPGAYAISRLSPKVKYGFIMVLFFTKMFPTVGIALPISITFLKWNLLDTNTGLVLAHLIQQIPFMAWILVSTFSAIPRDLEEAASIDGCNRMQTLMRIVFPVAMQGIATAAMYVWLNSWNEFTYALYLSLTTKTLPLSVYYYVQRGGFFQQAAYATILAIPVMIITFVLQRYLKSDYLSGAVKG
ncbi:carbohydrate ABC transporter permease [Breznakiella homolactica]|uniref:Maltose/maltodextrin transport system permease protein MalG n=1 Tax=Breznakiella homolactica TaxID=2798577 RepID=A0A7T7XK68_9SPIR|nr:carbohydrate ABC transporter permease [Breznakiella homolactica]QQO07920.1 carbohydrate ABC transporter permease [Breznakiella homolactica]